MHRVMQVFVIAGDIDIDETKDLVNKYFGEIPDKGDKPIKIIRQRSYLKKCE